MVDATTVRTPRPLLPELFTLLAAHRAAFRQDRPFQRCQAALLGWLCAFGRHTLTQVLLALGLGESDWTAWYRLFSRARVDYDRLSGCLLEQTLGLAPADGPYLVGLDATQIPRHSRTMPGSSWLRHLGTAVFAAGLHRAQRFLHLAWLPLPSLSGDSRAVPLRFLPAFPAKAVPAPGHPPLTEWEAGVAALGWLRQELDARDRARQRILGVGDGSYSTAKLWAALPARVTVLARCAKNRALYALPTTQPPRGRRRLYGARHPRPDAWLAERGGWQRSELAVRGRTIPIRYQVEGPCLVKGAPQQPLFLLVVNGSDPARGRKQRPATFWLVAAVRDGERWVLPWPAPALLGWAWQRWELEVAHRELKRGFGLGEPQAWSPAAAVLTVQWTAWAYAVLVLAGLRAWGLGGDRCRPPGAGGPGRGAGRWPGCGKAIARNCGAIRPFTGFAPGSRPTGGKWPTGWPRAATPPWPPAAPEVVRAPREPRTTREKSQSPGAMPASPLLAEPDFEEISLALEAAVVVAAVVRRRFVAAGR